MGWVQTAYRALDRVEIALRGRVGAPWPWWAWPTLLFLAGASTWAVSLLFAPARGESITFLGDPWGGACAFRESTGLPCPQCGMTRSWVHLARLHIGMAWFYNPAGAVLWTALVTCGAIGATRLLTRDPRRLTVPDRWLAAGALAFAAVYLGGWLLRVNGIHPLP